LIFAADTAIAVKPVVHGACQFPRFASSMLSA
jgi:hypothetical protein